MPPAYPADKTRRRAGRALTQFDCDAGLVARVLSSPDLLPGAAATIRRRIGASQPELLAMPVRARVSGWRRLSHDVGALEITPSADTAFIWKPGQFLTLGVETGVEVGDGGVARVAAHHLERIAGADRAARAHPRIDAGAPAARKLRRKALRRAGEVRELVAGDARRRQLRPHRTDRDLVAGDAERPDAHPPRRDLPRIPRRRRARGKGRIADPACKHADDRCVHGKPLRASYRLVVYISST
ncbi:MAG: hypothetical protein AcusKO_06010 [Acuticoccus sp.]